MSEPEYAYVSPMTNAAVATKTDVAGPGRWIISDEVTQLREWGTGIAHRLARNHGELILGSAPGCWLRLWDPSGHISRRHAVITRSENGWAISDLGSKNGIYVDGVQVAYSVLVPGAEIRIGPVTLIAESPRLFPLRSFLERLLGWSDARREEVDQALFSVRAAATHREPLLICGAGNLEPIARTLHHHIVGDKPFIVSKPRTPYASGVDALSAAAGGTLCIWRHQQPEDFDEVVSGLCGPFERAFLIVCGHALPKGNDIASQIVTVVRSIRIPALAERGQELHRIIDEYADESIAAFKGGWIASADREWVAGNASGSLHQLEMATRRIVALHACDESVTQASKLLRMSHGSLSDWLARRTMRAKPTMPYEEEDDIADE
jgi:hypothetical protein